MYRKINFKKEYNMGKNIRIFFTGIANSFRSDAYYATVTPTKRFGEIIKDTNNKRAKSSRRISKVTDCEIRELTRTY